MWVSSDDVGWGIAEKRGHLNEDCSTGARKGQVGELQGPVYLGKRVCACRYR